MRTTIDIPDDLHHSATSLARHNNRSLSQVVAELMRLGLQAPAAPANQLTESAFSPVTGLPVMNGATRPITDEDVRALDDEW